MPVPEKRLSEKQLEETIGQFTVDESSARSCGLDSGEVERIKQGVRAVVAESAQITAKYNEIAGRTGAEPVKTLGAEVVEADRSRLEALMTEDYSFVTPFGHNENRERSISVILSGLVHFDSFGHDGFETTEESLHIHGPGAAVLTSTVKMSGSGETKNLSTGDVHEADFSGTYRTTHTYVFEDSHWRLEASQMTAIPSGGEEAVVAHS